MTNRMMNSQCLHSLSRQDGEKLRCQIASRIFVTGCGSASKQQWRGVSRRGAFQKDPVMKSIFPFALLVLSASIAPAIAQTATPDSAMAKDDHMMAKDDKMMPAMSKADMATLERCKKMPPAKAKKKASCVKMMAMHPDSAM
jgi:hypothetical protein